MQGTVHCRVLSHTLDLLKLGLLRMVSEVPHNLAFAPPNNFLLAGSLRGPRPPLHECTHCGFSQRCLPSLEWAGPLPWTPTTPSWNNSTSASSHLPSLVKLLVSFKFRFKRWLLWETFPAALWQTGCCFFGAFLGTSQIALLYAYRQVCLLSSSHTSLAAGSVGHLLSLFVVSSFLGIIDI